MNIIRTTAAAVISVFITSAGLAGGATFTFQQGAVIPDLGIASYDGTSDNLLLGWGWGEYNQGGQTYGSVGGFNSSTDYRSILRFDLSSLSGLTVTSAALRLTSAGTGSTYTDATVNVYELFSTNSAWIEGNSTAFSTDNTASTWNWAGPDTVAWKDAAGTDLNTTYLNWQPYDTTAIASFQVSSADATGNMELVTFSDLSFIQDWIDSPASNAGFAIVSTALEGGSDRYWRFASSENGTASYRPTLIIEAVPEPASAVVLLLGSVALLRRKKRHAAQ